MMVVVVTTTGATASDFISIERHVGAPVPNAGHRDLDFRADQPRHGEARKRRRARSTIRNQRGIGYIVQRIRILFLDA